MHAANSIHAAELLGEPQQAAPFQAAGWEALARELIAISQAQPASTNPDRDIVDGWAERLGLSRWYVWKAAE